MPPPMADGSPAPIAPVADIPEWMPPLIQIKIGSPQVWISASISALRVDPDIFVRDKELAHVTRTTEEDAIASEWTDERGKVQRSIVPGAPRIRTMTLPTLRVRMARWAAWTKPVKARGGFEDQACEPTKAMAEEVRDEGQWPGLRHLAGVSECPFPRPDLSIVQGLAHYDRATRYLYEPSIDFQRVPDRWPSIEDAQRDAVRSREALEDVFSDFPFATDAGVSGAVSLVLTLVARPAILGPVPAFMVAATTPGTGKSLMADCSAGIALGREAGRFPFPDSTGRNGDAEIEKRLGFIARGGDPVVNFDNVDKVEVGGDSLELVISAPKTYTFRILGLTDGLTLPWRTVLVFTGNNPRWSFGMNRRLIVITLESPFADPEKRPIDSYKHPERENGLLEYVLAHRAELVCHALTIIRAYAYAGSPSPLTIGTFDAWARVVPSAIVWCGGVDPMLCRPGADGEESDATAQRATFAREWTAFLAASSLTAITAHDMVDSLYPARQFGQSPPSPTPQWDELRGAIEGFAPSFGGKPPEGAKLALALRGIAKSPIRIADAPAPLRMFSVEGRTGGRSRWCVVDVDPKKGPRMAGKKKAERQPVSPALSEYDALLAQLKAQEAAQGGSHAAP